MKTLTTVLAVSVCLSLAGVAGGAAYDDAADDVWSAAGTWTPAGGPPAAGDTALVDSNTVKLDGDLLTGTTAPDLITLGGTGMLQLATNSSRTVDSPVTIPGQGTIEVRANNWWNSRVTLTSALGGAGKLVVQSNNPQNNTNASSATLALTGANATLAGGVDINSGAWVRANADQALGTGTVNVNSGQLMVGAAQTYVSNPVINVYSGGTFAPAVNPGAPLNLDVELRGGALRSSGLGSGARPAQELTGTVSVHTDSQLTYGYHYDRGLKLSGLVQGPGKLTVLGSWVEAPLRLSHANNTYSGGTDVNRGILMVEADTALGSGAVNVNGVAGASPVGGPFPILHVVGNTDNYAPGAQPLINIAGGGTYKPEGTVGLDITANDGSRIRGWPWSDPNVTGTVTLNGAVQLQTDGSWGNSNLRISGKIVDGVNPGKVVVDWGLQTAVALSNGGNTFSGGVDVNASQLVVSAAGALGSGSVNVQAGYRADVDGLYNPGWYRYLRPLGGWLKTSAAGSLDSAAEVNVNANGLLEISSTETALVNVKTGGALKRSGGATVFDYDPASANQTFNLQPGAILDTALLAVPSYAVVSALSGGDGRFGVYLGTSGTDANAYTFGDDGSANIYRGLAVLNNAGISGEVHNNPLTYQGVATEAGSSTDGIGFYAQTGNTLTLDGGGGCTLNAPNGVYLDGGGKVVFKGTVAGSFATVDKYGTGELNVADAAGLSGKTVNVHQGWLTFGAADSPDGGTFVIDSAAGPAAVVLDKDISATTGAITAKPGGWVRVDSNSAALGAASGKVTYELGSRILLQDYQLNGAAVSLGEGKADVLIREHDDQNKLPDGGVELGNGWRLTVAPNPFGDTVNESIADSGAGILMSAGAAVKEAKLAASGGRTLELLCKVNLGAGSTLVIGDPDPYVAIRSKEPGTYGDAWSACTISQDGVVFIRTDSGANSLDKVRIRAGELWFGGPGGGGASNANSFGGATEVDLDGGDLGLLLGNRTLATRIVGTGQVNVGHHTWGGVIGVGSRTLTLQSTAGLQAALSPGHSIGQLDFLGSVTLAAGAGGELAQVVIEIPSDDGAGGTDHDLVTVSRTLTLAADAAELVLGLPAPNVNMKPATLNAAVMTANSVSGTFTSVVVDSPAPLNTAVTGATVAGYYDVSAVLNYSSTAISVVGSGTMWTAHMGDATLDDSVDVFDLAALANNYQVVAAQDWTTADYDLNGIVDVFDLAELANNYGWTAGGGSAGLTTGGDPVPEPASLGLIVLGACLPLLRRRRR